MVERDSVHATITVVVVDDHPLVREALSLFLNAPDIQVVAKCGDAASALEAIERIRPQVVLMDMVMPGKDGLAMTRDIKSKHPEIAVIIYSAFGNYVVQALEAGASGYFLKTVESKSLQDQVRVVARGTQSFVLGRGLEKEFAESGSQQRSGSLLRKLTSRELEIMKAMADGASNRTIAEKLGLSATTVRNHVTSILGKLETNSRDKAVALYVGAGSEIPTSQDDVPDPNALEPMDETWRRPADAKLGARNRRPQRIHDANYKFLSASVSHELRQPLHEILSFADLLAHDRLENLTQQQQEYLAVILRGCRRLDALINDLLDLSRLDAGGFELTKRVFRVDELLSETVQSFTPIFSQKQQTLRSEIEVGDTLLAADRDRLGQVLANLLSNASKYSTNGTTVTLKARAQDGVLSIEVIDEGIGIRPADMARIFTPFFRSDDPYIRNVPGTGLGLAIVKSIIELHGGEVTALSEPGRGSTFGFDVPGVLIAP